MDYRTLLAMAPVALLAACGTSVDPDAVKETVAAVETGQLQAIASDDIDGATGVFHADAVMHMPDGRVLNGSEAIRGEFEKMLADPALKVKYTQGQAWASEGGDLAVTSAKGEFTATGADGEPATMAFNNQTVWRKADSGPWLIVSDVNYPAAAPAAAPASAAAPQ